jgi:moderate conductance mechanosensitive channel
VEPLLSFEDTAAAGPVHAVREGTRMEQIREWLEPSWVRIVVAVVLTWAAIFLVRWGSGRLVRLVMQPSLVLLREVDEPRSQVETRFVRRVGTLERFVTRAFGTVAVVALALYVLYVLNVQLYGLIAGAGIAGIAVAFGAQTLVRDALSGIFLLIENPYDVGDFVRLNAIEGEVTAISLRRTILIGDDGTEHTVPNGAIVQTTNFSRDSVQHSLVVRVAADVPYERIVEVVDGVAQTFATAPEVADRVIEGPRVRGIVAFRSDSYDVEIRTRLHRGLRRQWPVTLNRQLMQACAANDVRVL